jgi:hypothetical protein
MLSFGPHHCGVIAGARRHAWSNFLPAAASPSPSKTRRLVTRPAATTYLNLAANLKAAGPGRPPAAGPRSDSESAKDTVMVIHDCQVDSRSESL